MRLGLNWIVAVALTLGVAQAVARIERSEIRVLRYFETSPDFAPLNPGYILGSAEAQQQPNVADPARDELPSADVVPDRPPASSPKAPADPSVQSGAGLPACLAWSDGCVTCERTDGKISCSNIGIACQPAEVECTERKQGDGRTK